MSNFVETSATSEVGRERTRTRTVRWVHDELDLRRATQLQLDICQALSADGLMKGWVRDLGMRDSSQIVYIRYYGPLNNNNDKTWVPNGVELLA